MIETRHFGLGPGWFLVQGLDPDPKTRIYIRPRPKHKPKDPNIFGSGPK